MLVELVYDVFKFSGYIVTSTISGLYYWVYPPIDEMKAIKDSLAKLEEQNDMVLVELKEQNKQLQKEIKELKDMK